MAGYEWSYETSIKGPQDLAAEDWMREIWERGPRSLRIFLSLAWKYGLGLRLGASSDATRVLGWQIASNSPSAITVEADSPLMTAENSVTVHASTLCWQTVVTQKNPVGRILWMPARLVHQWLIPRSVQRAVHHAEVGEAD